MSVLFLFSTYESLFKESHRADQMKFLHKKSRSITISNDFTNCANNSVWTSAPQTSAGGVDLESWSGNPT